MPQLTLRDIAERVNGELHGDAELQLDGAAQIDKAVSGQITFLANSKYKHLLRHTRASAVIVDKNIKVDVDIPHIKVENAYYHFLQVFLLFYPREEVLEPGVHQSAIVASTARIGKHVTIGENVVIGKNCVVGDRSKLLSGCVLMDNVKIGQNCLIYPLVSVRENCIIGNEVIIHNGAVIGSDGFGFAFHEGEYHKIPQIGRVIIEDNVEIGANCTIDRATMGDTVIHKGVKLDNLVHIAHNVEVGESTVMAAQAGISGSTKIGHHVMIGGQVGTVGHIRLGNFVQVGAQSGVAKNVPDNEVVFGYPARPIMRTKRIEAVINQLPELTKKVRQLESKLDELNKKNRE